METLPLCEQRVVGIDEKGVIKLITQLLLQWTQAGEIDHKATGVQSLGCKPHREAAAIPVNKPAVAGMLPLAMTAGIPLKPLAAGERR